MEQHCPDHKDVCEAVQQHVSWRTFKLILGGLFLIIMALIGSVWASHNKLASEAPARYATKREVALLREETVAELRGLRGDIMDILKSKRP